MSNFKIRVSKPRGPSAGDIVLATIGFAIAIILGLAIAAGGLMLIAPLFIDSLPFITAFKAALGIMIVRHFTKIGGSE